MLRSARRSAAGFALAVALGTIAGCGGASGYGEDEVRAAFAKHGIELDEVMRSRAGDESPLELILGLRDETGTCLRLELEATIFDSARSVQLYLLKTIGGEQKRRYRFGTSLLLIEGNVMVGVETTSKCIRVRDVEAALAEL